MEERWIVGRNEEEAKKKAADKFSKYKWIEVFVLN